MLYCTVIEINKIVQVQKTADDTQDIKLLVYLKIDLDEPYEMILQLFWKLPIEIT